MESQSAKRRILIVDDDEKLIETVVRDLGGDYGDFETHGFTSGRAAWNALQLEPMDVVIVNWKLPDVSGRIFIREARRYYPDLVTFLMTPADSPETSALVESVPAHHYLPNRRSSKSCSSAMRTSARPA